jgi:hypothetical protein
MKNQRSILFDLSMLALTAVLISSCAPAAAPAVTEPQATPEATEAPVVELPSATFSITGLVDNPLQLADADLKAMEAVTLSLEHPKNGPTEYTGVRLNDLLNQAVVQSGATILTLTASDGFTSDVDLATVQACTDCLVAFDPDASGVYNAAMPGQSGKAWVKSLVSIEVK